MNGRCWLVKRVAALVLFSFSSAAIAIASSSTQDIQGEMCPTRLYVNASAPAGGSGQTWATSLQSLSAALTYPGSCAEVWVAAGTYTPGPAGNRLQSFRLKSGFSIYGGFRGDEASLEERDWHANPTILSGDLNRDDQPGFLNRSDNSYHVVWAEFSTTSVVLDGITVRGGNANGTEPVDLRGGGFLVKNGSVLTIRNCTIEDNQATDLGGGFYASASSANVQSTTFRCNKSEGTAGAFGSQYPSATDSFTDCTFEGNYARTTGGAVYGLRGSISLDRCRFIRNIADLAAGAGGAICSSAQTLQANRCTFHGNRARNGGGTYFVHNTGYGPGHAQINNCSYVGNYAYVYGGAIYNWGCLVDVINCTFTANLTEIGGSYVLYNKDAAASTITNSILWSNGKWLIREASTPTVLSYTDAEVFCSGTHMIQQEPRFVRAASAGADGLWGTQDDDYGDMRLQTDSPCIDIGNNEAVPPGTVSDLADAVRILDHSGKPNDGNPPNARRVVDLGSYEFVSVFRGDYDRDGDVDLGDIALFEECALGPRIPYPAGCSSRDLDIDGDADSADFASLQRCQTGEHMPADIACQ